MNAACPSAEGMGGNQQSSLCVVLLKLSGQGGLNMCFRDTIHTVGKNLSIFGERKINQSIKTAFFYALARPDNNQMVRVFALK